MSDAAPPNPAPTTTPAVTPPSTTPTPSPTAPTTTEAPAELTSLLNQESDAPKPETPPGAPETYADFTAPEGITLDKDAIAAASSVFKEAGLTQEQAQAVVNAQAVREADMIKRQRESYDATRLGWQNEVKTEFGTKLPEVRTEIGRMLNLLPPEVSAGFRVAMNVTGAGDNPAFVRTFYSLAKMVNEGKPVNGSPPPNPKRPNGAGTSAAQRVYPNLPA